MNKIDNSTELNNYLDIFDLKIENTRINKDNENKQDSILALNTSLIQNAFNELQYKICLQVNDYKIFNIKDYKPEIKKLVEEIHTYKQYIRELKITGDKLAFPQVYKSFWSFIYMCYISNNEYFIEFGFDNYIDRFINSDPLYTVITKEKLYKIIKSSDKYDFNGNKVFNTLMNQMKEINCIKNKKPLTKDKKEKIELLNRKIHNEIKTFKDSDFSMIQYVLLED